MTKLKKVAIIILVSYILLLAGCTYGSYKIIMGEVDFSKDGASGSYEEFSGYKATSLKLEEGVSINLNLKVKTDTGSLAVEILDDADNVVLKLNSDREEQEEEAVIKSTGKYKIKVAGDKHKGEFKLAWKINKKS